MYAPSLLSDMDFNREAFDEPQNTLPMNFELPAGISEEL